ncbi:MAG: calcium-binding protein [Methylovulum sp.]|nr:calcium-binding protein [Methylovulum sp.]
MAKLIGTKNNDYMPGTEADDEIYGRDGNDNIQGNGGNDLIYGEKGDDYLFGGDGNDRLFGGNGSDNLIGGNGNDYLNGGSGYNYFEGGDGNDVMTGWGSFIPGMGKDTMIGSGNQDTFFYYDAAESWTSQKTQDVIKNFGNNDILDLSYMDANQLTTKINESFVRIDDQSDFWAAGQIKFDAATNSLIANTDNDFSSIEFSVKLSGVISLQDANLVL